MSQSNHETTRSTQSHFEAISDTIRSFIRTGMILEHDIKGKKVLDLECGMGAGPKVFAELGARLAIGIDFYLAEHLVNECPKSNSVHY